MANLVLHPDNIGPTAVNTAFVPRSTHFDTPGPEQFGFKDLMRIIARHKTMLAIVVGLTTSATLIWQLTAPRLYSSTANVQVELIDDVGTNQADIQAKNVQRIANEVKLYRSRAAAEQVAEGLSDAELDQVIAASGTEPQGSRQRRVARAISLIKDMLRVEAEEGSDLIEVTATARSARVATLIANAFPPATAKMKTAKSNDRRRSLLQALEAERVTRAQQAAEKARMLADFRLQNNMLVGSGSVEDLQQINRISAEAASAIAARAGTAAQSAGMARAARMTTPANATSPVLQSLERQEADLSAEYARMAPTFGANHPDMVRITSQLNEVRHDVAAERARAISIANEVASVDAARMTQIARSEADREAARAGQLQGIVGRLAGKARSNTINTVKLEELDRAAEASAKAYNDIAQRISLVRSEMLVGGVTSTLISPAVADDDPVSPLPLKMTMIAFLASSLLGLLLVFAKEMTDDKLRTMSQVRRLFGRPTFGMLPLLAEAPSEKIEENPVINDPQSLYAEVARSTLVEVNALAPTGASQSVLITSPLPGDGKSVVAMTLAVAAMVMGKRVVIVDLDLRKASILQRIHRELDTPELLDVLRGRVDLQALDGPETQASATLSEYVEPSVDMSRLTLLSATNPVPEPAALLTSGRIHRLIADLKARHDVVLINAPPTLAVRDARTMCEFADQTIMVARWGLTTIDQMSASLEMLGAQNVAGVIFNQVDYAEHARRRYGDSIEFYMHAADYYRPNTVPRVGPLKRLRHLFGARSVYAANYG